MTRRLTVALLRGWESYYCSQCGWWYSTPHRHG